MIAEVYDALLEAGASEEKSRRAAETLASYDDRFFRIEQQLGELRGSIRLLQWQVGALFALIAPAGAWMLWAILSIGSKIGAFS
jgi:hypothetical protein